MFRMCSESSMKNLRHKYSEFKCKYFFFLFKQIFLADVVRLSPTVELGREETSDLQVWTSFLITSWVERFVRTWGLQPPARTRASNECPCESSWSRRRPLLLAVSHLRHYAKEMLTPWTWNWDTDAIIIRDGRLWDTMLTNLPIIYDLSISCLYTVG